MITLVIAPGYVTSQYDDQVYYIDANRLRQLYRVREFLDERPDTRLVVLDEHSRIVYDIQMGIPIPGDAIYLRPNPYGEYKIPWPPPAPPTPAKGPAFTGKRKITVRRDN